MKKLRKIFACLAGSALLLGLSACSDIDESNEAASYAGGKGIVRFAISENEDSVLKDARTVFPVTGNASEFTNITLGYKTYSYSSSSTELGKWSTYDELKNFEVALSTGSYYFTITAERYGATFTQTTGKTTVEAGKSFTLTFDSLSVPYSSESVGKISVTLKFPSSIASSISKVYAGYSEDSSYSAGHGNSEESELTYDSETTSATFTREKAKSGNNVLYFLAKDADGKQIFVYPLIVQVKAGYLSSATIDASTGDAITQDASRMVKVTYKVNDETATATDYVQNYYPGCAIVGITTTKFSVTGKKFTQWNTAADGTGTTYNENNTPDLTENTTLYAIWVDASAKIVTYNSNYPIGANTSVTQPAEGTFSIKSVEDTGFAVKGYKFTGWNRAKDGSSTSMIVGDKLSIETDITLFAQWRPYEITYDMNGGSDDKEFSEKIDNKTLGTGTVTAKIPSQKYDYYTFLGWSTSPNAASATYTKGVSISLSDDTTLYAVWKLGTIVEDENTISVGSNSTVSLPFIILKSESLSLTMYASGSAGLDFYIQQANSTGGYLNIYSYKGVTSSTTKTISLDAGEYKIVVGNENILLSKSAKRTLKSAD